MTISTKTKVGICCFLGWQLSLLSVKILSFVENLCHLKKLGDTWGQV